MNQPGAEDDEPVLTLRIHCKSAHARSIARAAPAAVSAAPIATTTTHAHLQHDSYLIRSLCPRHYHLPDSPPGKFSASPHSPSAIAAAQTRNSSSPDTERDDAIWEQFASPDTRPPHDDDELHRPPSPTRAPSAHTTSASCAASQIWRIRSSDKTVSALRHPFESSSVASDSVLLLDSPQRQLQQQQFRHRSLDRDRIHISEPDLHRLCCSKPLLSDNIAEPDFSFRPKTSQHPAPSPDNDVSLSSPSAPAVTLLSTSTAPPPYPSSSNSSAQKAAILAVPAATQMGALREEEEQVPGKPTTPLSTTTAEEARIDVRGLLTEAETKIYPGGSEGMKGRSLSPPYPTTELEVGAKMSCDEDREARTARKQSSKRLLSVRTKSRLIEATVPSSPIASTSLKRGVAGGDMAQSPARPSVRVMSRMEETEEEDPFKDVDIDDKFKKGNCKPVTVAQWAALVLIMASLLCSLTVKGLKGKKAWELELWKWAVMAMVIVCGRLVSGWAIHAMVIVCEKNFLFRTKVLYFVYGVRKGVQNCLWLGLVLAAWKLVFDPDVQSHRILSFVTKLFECFVIAAFLWLAKLLLVKCLASSFHVSAFFERIQVSLFEQHVLEALSVPCAASSASPPRPSSASKPLNIGHIQKLSAQTVSAGTISRLMSLVKAPGFGMLVTTIDQSVRDDEDDDDSAMKDVEINSELQAKAAGKKIFKNVAQPDSRFIVKDDLLRFLPAEEVDRVMGLIEGAKDTGKITKKALKNWVVKVYQERRSLAHSLNDTKTAVKELHRMASVIVVIIIVVVWLLVLGIASTHVLVFVGSQMLLVAFMFGNTVKQIFEAIIFLFVMHPYDVGDRCIIDGVQLIVEEMKILTTIFLKPDNEKVFYPNSVLATKPISNLYRSPDMKEFLFFSVHISTPVDKIDALKDRVAKYVESKSEHWQPKFSILVSELEDLNQLKLSFSLQHTINFQNFGERMIRRSDLLLFLKRCFAELEMEYRLLAQPIQLLHPNAANNSGAYLYPPAQQVLTEVNDTNHGMGWVR